MTQPTDENSYRNILKRLSAFGGVQVFNVILALARGKLVAMFLGPVGMGISSLYNSAATSLQQIGLLGVNLAVVKEAAAVKDDRDKLRNLMAAVYRLIIFTSLLGGAICFLLSPLLSVWTFGSADYTVGFMLLSLSVALSIAGLGYLALLQGVGAVKELTKASFIGGATGLCVGVPLYYFFGNDGIVPAMIAVALSMFIFYLYSFRKTGLTEAARFSWREHKSLIKRLLSVGIVLMIGSLVATLTGYLINAFVRIYGNLEDVGYYQAANSMTNQYMGMIFAALTLDYFPRLSAVANDNAKMNEVYNRQIEIVCLIAGPLVMCLIATAPLIIRLFLTERFLSVAPLMKWMGIGVLLQVISFPQGYVLIVRNRPRLYVALEVVMANLLWIACSVALYLQFQLIGLGMSLIARCVIGDSIAYWVMHRAFGLRLTRGNLLNILMAVAMSLVLFGMSAVGECPWPVYAALILASAIYSFIRIKKKI